MRLFRIFTFIAAAWRAGGEPEPCRHCRGPLAVDDVMVCAPCMAAASDQIVRARLAELEVNEAVALARGIALRDGERELAAALQAVLLLHLAGGSLAPIAGMAAPERTQRDVVN